MMGFFGFLQRPDLGQGLERFAATPNALLLDVRTQEEYADGHIPESPLPGRRPSSSTVSAASGAVRRPACCGAWGILM